MILTLSKFFVTKAISLNSKEIFGLVFSSIASMKTRILLLAYLPNSSSFF